MAVTWTKGPIKLKNLHSILGPFTLAASIELRRRTGGRSSWLLVAFGTAGLQPSVAAPYAVASTATPQESSGPSATTSFAIAKAAYH